MGDYEVERTLSFTPAADYPALVTPVQPPSTAELPYLNKEIKLWKPQAIPLAGTSVSHDDFKAHPLGPPPQSQRVGYTPNPHKLQASTTAADAYQAWKLEPPAPPPSAGYAPSPHKFDATSVSHDDFRAHPMSPPPQSQRVGYTPNPHKLQSTTTTADAYRAISLPRGVQALGVRTVNNGFHTLIPASAAPPARGAAVFTTTSDGQTEVAIKVLAELPGGHYEPLGSFELAGVPQALLGVPQLVVTFDLDEDMVLRVSADDRTRPNHRVGIIIRDRLPTPPRERPSY